MKNIIKISIGAASAALILGAVLLMPRDKAEEGHAITCAASAKMTYTPVTEEPPEIEEPVTDTDLPDSPVEPLPSDDEPGKPESPSKVTPDQKGMMNIDGMYVRAPKPLDESSLTRFCEKLKTLKADYLASASSVKLAVIPDKSYYVKDKTDSYLDHGAMMASIGKSLDGWDVIDLEGSLSIDSYYTTDPHWRQERILPVARLIASSYGFQTGEFTQQSHDGFIGDYKRDIGDGVSEKIVWLESEQTKGAAVDNFQHPEYKSVYEPSLLSTISPYDIFLGGPSPLVTITNPQVTNDKHLVLFCDSYGSSLAPLLLEGYSKITLVDLRYMVSSLLPEHVSFDNADVLFIYSAELVNNSALLR